MSSRAYVIGMETHHKPYYALPQCLRFVKDFCRNLNYDPGTIYAYNPYTILLILKRNVEIIADIPNSEVVCELKIGMYSYIIHTTQYMDHFLNAHHHTNNDRKLEIGFVDVTNWKKYEMCTLEAAAKVFVMIQDFVFGDENRFREENESNEEYSENIKNIVEHKKLLGKVLLQHCPLSLNSKLAEKLIMLMEDDSIINPTFPGLVSNNFNPRIIIDENKKIQPSWSINTIANNKFEILHPTWRNYAVELKKANSTSDLPSISNNLSFSKSGDFHSVTKSGSLSLPSSPAPKSPDHDVRSKSPITDTSSLPIVTKREKEDYTVTPIPISPSATQRKSPPVITQKLPIDRFIRNNKHRNAHSVSPKK